MKGADRMVNIRGRLMNIKQLKEELIFDEGIVLHEYKDHLGYSTIGIGRLIDERKGGGITEEEAMYLLENDIGRKQAQLRENLPFWNKLSDNRQRALMNMAFQLGVNGLLKFRQMLWAIENGKWDLAHAEALDSSWANQTPVRARRVAEMIKYG
jgi:lysozyme